MSDFPRHGNMSSDDISARANAGAGNQALAIVFESFKEYGDKKVALFCTTSLVRSALHPERY